MTLEQAIDFCADLGFEAVDPTGYYFPGHPAPPTDAYLQTIGDSSAARTWTARTDGLAPIVPILSQESVPVRDRGSCAIVARMPPPLWPRALATARA